MQSFSPAQLRKRVGNKKWIFAYNELMAMHDPKNNLVELIEDYAPPNGLFGEAWRALHFPRTSPCVVGARREGTKTLFRIKPGKHKLNLMSTFAPIGIEEVAIKGDEVRVTYAGLGGGGVSASFCRGLAKGVKRVEVIEWGGGEKFGKATVVLPRLEKLIISVDDTDTPEEGATYALVHNIAMGAQNPNVRYMTHVNAQLYPENPDKTKNCMSTAVSFAVKPGHQDGVVKYFERELKKYSLSKNTGMVVLKGILLPDAVREYALRAKRGFLTSVGEAKEIAKKSGVDVYEVTGPRGVIGAMAGLGMHDNPEFAASLPNIYEF